MRSACFSTLALVLAVSYFAGCQTEAPIAPTKTRAIAFDKEQSLASFDEMFERISQTYFKPERLGDGPDGIDWNGIKSRLRPRIENATDIGMGIH